MARWLAPLISSLFLLFAGFPAAAYEIISFPSLDGNKRLTAYLSIPEGDGPFLAVVLMHGCGGMHYSGGISPLYASWGKLFNEQGFVTLTVDSAGSRNLGATCGRGEKRIRMYRERPFDAYGALVFLQSQSFVRPDKIALVGWSQGGAVVLLTVVTESIARPDPPPEHDFAVAAAFYPALCNDRIQSLPFTKVKPHSWATKIPLLILQGAADNWTRPEPCDSFIKEVKERGNPVSIRLYPEAYHGFDAPGAKIRTLPQYKTAAGVIPIVGPNPEAREEAKKDISAFLREFLLPEKQE